LIYLPATLLFWRARKDAGAQVFAKSETLLFALIAVGAVIALWSLATADHRLTTINLGPASRG